VIAPLRMEPKDAKSLILALSLLMIAASIKEFNAPLFYALFSFEGREG
jgi:hypothetical protein